MYIDTTRAQEALYSLVGNRQTLSNDYPALPDTLTASISGRFFEESPNVAQDVIFNSYTISNTTAALWDTRTPYMIGDRAALDGSEYEALQPNTGTQPDTDPATWQAISILQLAYEQQRIESINALINDVRNKRMLPNNTKSILTQGHILDTQVNRRNLQPNVANQAVGLEFQAMDYDGMTIRLRQVGFIFTAPVTFTLYLYTYGQAEPIAQQEIVYTRPNSRQNFVLENFNIPMHSFAVGGAQWFSLVYYQDDIFPAQAIRIYRDNLYTSSCHSCGGFATNTRFVKQLNNYVTTRGIQAPEQPGREVWDQGNRAFTDSTNYGMSVNLSVECDITEPFISQVDLLTEALMLRYAYDVAIKTQSTRRTNTVEMRTRRGVIGTANGMPKAVPSSADVQRLEKLYHDQLEQISLDFSDWKSPCFPGVHKGGLSFSFGR